MTTAKILVDQPEGDPIEVDVKVIEPGREVTVVFGVSNVEIHQPADPEGSA